MQDAKAARGWGGLLYQTALEVATRLPPGLGFVSERDEVAPAAVCVWAQFHERAARGEGVRKTAFPPSDAYSVEDLWDDIEASQAEAGRPPLNKALLLADIKAKVQWKGGLSPLPAVERYGHAWETSPLMHAFYATAFPVLESGKVVFSGPCERLRT